VSIGTYDDAIRFLLESCSTMTDRLQPTALSIAQLARLLTAAGGRTVSEETIRKDIEAGAPVNADGTMNLLHYAAWLVSHLREASGNRGETARAD
jgi:hypothetical protein